MPETLRTGTKSTVPNDEAVTTLEQRLNECHQTRRIRIHNLLAEERRIREELSSIHQRKISLEKALERNMDQRLDEVIAIERSECQSLCKAMQQYLPRELRDMVYEHVVGPAGWHNNHHTVTVQAPNDRSIPEKFMLIHTYTDVASIMSSDTLDNETRQELAEFWYKTSTFDFRTSLHLIKPFLKADVTDTGRPALDLVRQLEITVDCDDVSKPEKTKTLIGALEGFALLERPARLRITLHDTVAVTFYDTERMRLLFQEFKRLLPSLPGWIIEFVVEIVGNYQRYVHPNTADTPQGLVPGYVTTLLIRGNAEFSPSQWLGAYKQLRKEFEQYSYDTLNELYTDDNSDEEDAESRSSEDEDEDNTDDDECYDDSTHSRDELHELSNELQWCVENRTLDIFGT